MTATNQRRAAKEATRRGNAPCGYRWPDSLLPGDRHHRCTLPAGHSSDHFCGRCETKRHPSTAPLNTANN